MKKLFLVLLSLSLVLGAFVVEGGALIALLIATALVPITLGSLLTTLFSYRGVEIGEAFRDAFSERTELGRVAVYETDLLVIRNLNASVLGWSFTLLVLAVIGILSSLSDVHLLGPRVAAGTVSLLYGLILKTLLLTPMENSILKKIHCVGILRLDR
ncbi:MAG TPA: hypothetical protein VN426_07835 [Syntrophomonadaceae bacterium]|nr:hypothetical protein [Syntrophomonadaceae bacterium]